MLAEGRSAAAAAAAAGAADMADDAENPSAGFSLAQLEAELHNAQQEVHFMTAFSPVTALLADKKAAERALQAMTVAHAATSKLLQAAHQQLQQLQAEKRALQQDNNNLLQMHAAQIQTEQTAKHLIVTARGMVVTQFMRLVQELAKRTAVDATAVAHVTAEPAVGVPSVYAGLRSTCESTHAPQASSPQAMEPKANGAAAEPSPVQVPVAKRSRVGMLARDLHAKEERIAQAAAAEAPSAASQQSSPSHRFDRPSAKPAKTAQEPGKKPAGRRESKASKQSASATANGPKYKGTSFNKAKQKWTAQIWSQNKLYNLGWFVTPEEAAEAYRVAEQAKATGVLIQKGANRCTGKRRRKGEDGTMSESPLKGNLSFVAKVDPPLAGDGVHDNLQQQVFPPSLAHTQPPSPLSLPGQPERTQHPPSSTVMHNGMQPPEHARL
eukprot:jgi/Chlat1/6437/Chrsp45S05952